MDLKGNHVFLPINFWLSGTNSSPIVIFTLQRRYIYDFCYPWKITSTITPLSIYLKSIDYARHKEIIVKR